MTGTFGPMGTLEHGDPAAGPASVPPTADVAPAAEASAAEIARTIMAGSTTATLASLTRDGDPWASLVAYGLLGGAPVLCVSHLAEHGRNLAADPRASLCVSVPNRTGDPLATGRVTVAGRVETPTEDEFEAARSAHLAAVPAAGTYIDYRDFTLWVLRVRRVRWVGGYGRMSSATAADYAAALPDPVVPAAGPAIAHLNADHADSLLDMARALAGFPDAQSAQCTGADRYGLDLVVAGARGTGYARVGYARPLESVDGLRAATIELARRARAAVAVRPS